MYSRLRGYMTFARVTTTLAQSAPREVFFVRHMSSREMISSLRVCERELCEALPTINNGRPGGPSVITLCIVLYLPYFVRAAPWMGFVIQGRDWPMPSAKPAVEPEVV